MKHVIRKDSTREISPLRKAADAIELDTSNLTIEDQVDFIVARAKKISHEKKSVVMKVSIDKFSGFLLGSCSDDRYC